MGYIFDRVVYKPSSLETCIAVTGKKPIKTGWLDTNKGDKKEPNMRSRLVAKEFKWLARRNGRAALFAGTPPIECLRILLSVMTTQIEQSTLQLDDQMEMLILDVRRAHFYAKALRRVFVEMPKEDPRWHECQGVAELLMSLYGTQDASANWEAEYSKCLIEGGYQKGEASPCLFYNALSKVRALVHGDDFVAVGRRGP